VGDDGLDGVGVGSNDNGLGGGLSSDLDARHLVTDGGEDVGQESDEVGLNGGGDLGVLGNSADGIEGALAGNGILLVAELLLQELNSPGKVLVTRLPTAKCTGIERTWWGHRPPQCHR
jgi:hypothetical protein